MNIKPNQKAKKIKKYTLLLKFAVTIVCLWYVLGKIDFQIAKSALKSAEWLFLLLALISFLDVYKRQLLMSELFFPALARLRDN